MKVKRRINRFWGWIWLFNRFNSRDLRKIVERGFDLEQQKHNAFCKYCNRLENN